jgi:GH24 family phage-related lysozyme (muramidase)
MRAIIPTIWLEWNRPFEGHTKHLYIDSRGLVTAGVGNLLDATPRVPPWAPALELFWRLPDGRVATDAEVVAQWRTLKSYAVPERTVAEWRNRHGDKPLPLQLRGGATKEMQSITTIRLSPAAVEALVRKRLFEMAGTIRAQFSTWDSWPADAQCGLLSVAWARGPSGFATAFPRMTAALRIRDWEGAARECELRGGYEDRDAANRRCFLAAARCDREGLDPEIMHSMGAPSPKVENEPAAPSVVDVTLGDLRSSTRKGIEDLIASRSLATDDDEDA